MVRILYPIEDFEAAYCKLIHKNVHSCSDIRGMLFRAEENIIKTLLTCYNH